MFCSSLWQCHLFMTTSLVMEARHGDDYDLIPIALCSRVRARLDLWTQRGMSCVIGAGKKGILKIPAHGNLRQRLQLCSAVTSPANGCWCQGWIRSHGTFQPTLSEKERQGNRECAIRSKKISKNKQLLCPQCHCVHVVQHLFCLLGLSSMHHILILS